MCHCEGAYRIYVLKSPHIPLTNERQQIQHWINRCRLYTSLFLDVTNKPKYKHKLRCPRNFFMRIKGKRAKSLCKWWNWERGFRQWRPYWGMMWGNPRFGLFVQNWWIGEGLLLRVGDRYDRCPSAFEYVRRGFCIPLEGVLTGHIGSHVARGEGRVVGHGWSGHVRRH